MQKNMQMTVTPNLLTTNSSSTGVNYNNSHVNTTYHGSSHLSNAPLPYKTVNNNFTSGQTNQNNNFVSKSKLLQLNAIEQRDDLDTHFAYCYSVLASQISGLSDQEIHDTLNALACKGAQQYEEISIALLYIILTEPMRCQKSFRDLMLISRDGFNLVLTKLNQLVCEKWCKLLDMTRKQILWFTQECMKTGILGTDSSLLYLMRQIGSGDLNAKNLALIEALLDMFVNNQGWLQKNPYIIPYIVYTNLRLIADHYASGSLPQITLLRQREIEFTIKLLRTYFGECMVIGRDLLRLLQNVARIPEFDAFWQDMLFRPQTLVLNVPNIIKRLICSRTPRRYIISRIPPDLEAKLSFLIHKVKFGRGANAPQNRYFDWLIRQYDLNILMRRMSLLPDIVRYVCCVIHPSNEIIFSDFVPRWALLGWILLTASTSPQHNPMISGFDNSATSTLTCLSQCKLALFYDWWIYDASIPDSIMCVEPSILLIVNSLKTHPAMGQSLLEFLCLATREIPAMFNCNGVVINIENSNNNSNSQKNVLENWGTELVSMFRDGVRRCLKDILDKRVIPSLEPIMRFGHMNPDVAYLFRETFGIKEEIDIISPPLPSEESNQLMASTPYQETTENRSTPTLSDELLIVEKSLEDQRQSKKLPPKQASLEKSDLTTNSNTAFNNKHKNVEIHSNLAKTSETFNAIIKSNQVIIEESSSQAIELVVTDQNFESFSIRPPDNFEPHISKSPLYDSSYGSGPETSLDKSKLMLDDENTSEKQTKTTQLIFSDNNKQLNTTKSMLGTFFTNYNTEETKTRDTLDNIIKQLEQILQNSFVKVLPAVRSNTLLSSTDKFQQLYKPFIKILIDMKERYLTLVKGCSGKNNSSTATKMANNFEFSTQTYHKRQCQDLSRCLEWCFDNCKHVLSPKMEKDIQQFHTISDYKATTNQNISGGSKNVFIQTLARFLSHLMASNFLQSLDRSYAAENIIDKNKNNPHPKNIEHALTPLKKDDGINNLDIMFDNFMLANTSAPLLTTLIAHLCVRILTYHRNILASLTPNDILLANKVKTLITHIYMCNEIVHAITVEKRIEFINTFGRQESLLSTASVDFYKPQNHVMGWQILESLITVYTYQKKRTICQQIVTQLQNAKKRLKDDQNNGENYNRLLNINMNDTQLNLNDNTLFDDDIFFPNVSYPVFGTSSSNTIKSSTDSNNNGAQNLEDIAQSNLGSFLEVYNQWVLSSPSFAEYINVYHPSLAQLKNKNHGLSSTNFILTEDMNNSLYTILIGNQLIAGSVTSSPVTTKFHTVENPQRKIFMRYIYCHLMTDLKFCKIQAPSTFKDIISSGFLSSVPVSFWKECLVERSLSPLFEEYDSDEAEDDINNAKRSTPFYKLRNKVDKSIDYLCSTQSNLVWLKAFKANNVNNNPVDKKSTHSSDSDSDTDNNEMLNDDANYNSNYNNPFNTTFTQDIMSVISLQNIETYMFELETIHNDIIEDEGMGHFYPIGSHKGKDKNHISLSSISTLDRNLAKTLCCIPLYYVVQKGGIQESSKDNPSSTNAKKKLLSTGNINTTIIPSTVLTESSLINRIDQKICAQEAVLRIPSFVQCRLQDGNETTHIATQFTIFKFYSESLNMQKTVETQGKYIKTNVIDTNSRTLDLYDAQINYGQDINLFRFIMGLPHNYIAEIIDDSFTWSTHEKTNLWKLIDTMFINSSLMVVSSYPEPKKISFRDFFLQYQLYELPFESDTFSLHNIVRILISLVPDIDLVKSFFKRDNTKHTPNKFKKALDINIIQQFGICNTSPGPFPILVFQGWTGSKTSNTIYDKLAEIIATILNYHLSGSEVVGGSRIRGYGTSSNRAISNISSDNTNTTTLNSTKINNPSEESHQTIITSLNTYKPSLDCILQLLDMLRKSSKYTKAFKPKNQKGNKRINKNVAVPRLFRHDLVRLAMQEIYENTTETIKNKYKSLFTLCEGTLPDDLNEMGKRQFTQDKTLDYLSISSDDENYNLHANKNQKKDIQEFKDKEARSKSGALKRKNRSSGSSSPSSEDDKTSTLNIISSPLSSNKNNSLLMASSSSSDSNSSSESDGVNNAKTSASHKKHKSIEDDLLSPIKHRGTSKRRKGITSPILSSAKAKFDARNSTKNQDKQQSHSNALILDSDSSNNSENESPMPHISKLSQTKKEKKGQQQSHKTKSQTKFAKNPSDIELQSPDSSRSSEENFEVSKEITTKDNSTTRSKRNQNTRSSNQRNSKSRISDDPNYINSFSSDSSD